ncbi:cation:proton antiporter, partial [Bacillus cereus]
MLVLLTVIKPLMNKFGNLVEERGNLSQGHLGVIIALVLSAAAVTDYIGVYSVFGGFMLGLVMPKNPNFQRELRSKLEDIVVVFLVPIFFTYSGINTSFATLNYSLFVAFLAILSIAVASKYFACLLVMKRMGKVSGNGARSTDMKRRTKTRKRFTIIARNHKDTEQLSWRNTIRLKAERST